MDDWKTAMGPILQKLDVAAKFDGTSSWNATGSAALAGLIRQMAGIIDNQIEGRSRGHVDGSPHARELRLYGSVLNNWSKEELLLVVEWQMLQKYRTGDAERRIQELKNEIFRIAEERSNVRPVRPTAKKG